MLPIPTWSPSQLVLRKSKLECGHNLDPHDHQVNSSSSEFERAHNLDLLGWPAKLVNWPRQLMSTPTRWVGIWQLTCLSLDQPPPWERTSICENKFPRIIWSRSQLFADQLMAPLAGWDNSQPEAQLVTSRLGPRYHCASPPLKIVTMGTSQNSSG